MATYATNVSIDVRNIDDSIAPAAGTNPAEFVIDQLLKTTGSGRGISVNGKNTGNNFPVIVEADDINDADARLSETFRPRRVDGVDYAISWTLPRSANGGFFD